MDQVSEVKVPGGVLRVEVERAENDQAAKISAYLNGKPVTRERAQELVRRAQSRMEKSGAPAVAGDLRAEFIRLLTTDSPHQDRRRRDFNQAVFMADGRPVWTETTLDMIMAKFDRATRNLGRRSGQGEAVDSD